MVSRADSFDGHGPLLSVERLQIGRRMVLAAAGEIDLGSAPVLPAAVAEALELGAQDLWIDLTDVTFIDSSGVHALLDARTRVLALGRRLAVICPAGTARRTLMLTGLDTALPLYASREEAHRSG